MARWAWWSRDRIVPPDTPSISAITRGFVSEVIAKHEDRALFRLQSTERAVHDVPIDDTRELVARGVIGELEDLEP